MTVHALKTTVMKNQKNPGGNNPDVNTGKSTGTERNPDGNKKAELKPKNEEVWKDPDPTTPERKHDPDPTKPEREKGPMSDDTKKKNPDMKKNPARGESNADEDIGSLEERDIDDQGITGESKDDDDFSEEDEERRKSA
jgi:hypothetical protein